MNARTWKVLLSAALVVAAWAPAAAALARERPPAPAAHVAPPDAPATHNMMLVGETAAFLSHLPMFDSLDAASGSYVTPHRFQVILEVTFTRNGQDVTQLYLDDRKQHPGERMYTLNPAEFVLSDLFPGGSRPALASFRAASVFRGHLERPGNHRISALDGVTVNVKRVIHARMFDPAVPHRQRLTYILFGRGGELFLAHSITHPPDFDQILSVRVDGHAFTADELARGVEVTFPNLADAPRRRIRAESSATGEFRVAGAQQVLRLAVHAGAELYFEEGELQVPAEFETMPEERRSGF